MISDIVIEDNNSSINENITTEIKKKSFIKYKRTQYSKYYYGTIGEKFYYTELVIAKLTEQPEFQQMMNKLGYTPAKIREFLAVYDSARASRIKLSNATGNKGKAYEEFNKLYNSAVTEFCFVIKVAKIALRGYLELSDKLKLNIKRGRAFADYFAFMDSFYSQTLADPQILSRMSTFGYPEELLISCQKLYLDAKAAQQNYNSATAAANEAAREQKQKIAVMDQWMSEYYALLKVAEAQEDLRRKPRMDGE